MVNIVRRSIPSLSLTLIDRQTRSRLDFTDCSEQDLKALADYCDPATFGRNKEDVYDEAYRKAGKLDNTNFAMNLVPGHCGLIDNIRDLLLEGHDDSTAIRCELYKLNVYGTY